MKPLVLFVSVTVIVLFAACSSSQETNDITLPALVYQEPLPPFPKPTTSPTLRIALQIHVRKDGTVDDVLFLNSSGSVAWDSAAISTIRRWKYSPARCEKQPINIWLHQTAVVTFSEPQYITLAEILCSTAEQADTVFLLLEQGADFTDLVLKYSVASSQSSNGILGTVNIQMYPEHIKRVLSRLRIGKYTEPTQYGAHFAIFKRLQE